jgi:hypothetical protein
LQQDFKDGAKFALEKMRNRRQIREKIHRAYLEDTKGGMVFSESLDRCLERFADQYKSETGCPLTERVFSNIVSRPAGAITDSLTEATVIVQMQRLMADSEELRSEVDAQLEKLDDRADTDWIETESEDTTGGKFEGNKTKKVPISTKRLQLLKEKIAINDKFFDSVKALLPKQNINIFTRSGDVTMIDDNDLTAQIRKFEQNHKRDVVDTTFEES